MIVPHIRKVRVLFVPSGCSVDRRLKSEWKFADRLGSEKDEFHSRTIIAPAFFSLVGKALN